MKKSILLLFAAFATLMASAQTKVEIDGIWYNLVSKVKQAEVTSGGDYSGSITIPATVTYEGVDYSVTSIGKRAFNYCISLTTITIPEGVTSIAQSAFEYCSSLTAINIPESVTSIELSAFSDCSSLTAINIPESVTSIGNYAFWACRGLSTITLPEGVTSIGWSTFSGCSSLTTITLPESLTSIGDYAFSDCSSLTAITLPKGVTSIAQSAFEYCSSLTSIVLPKNLTSIGKQAFANCAELLDIYCYAESVPSTRGDAFEGSYPEYITLHVPASVLEAYKNTEPWSCFGTIVELGAAITRITLDKTSTTLTEGDTLTLTMATTPDNADTNLISWSSSNPCVATVDNTGKVTAVAPGTATITAMANDGSGVSASCEVTVSPAKYVLTVYLDGEVFVTDTLSRGTIITLPDEPTKEGYTFSGWSEVPETMPANDVTVSGTFTINKYLVTFKIGDEVIAANSLEYGAAIIAPEAPEKEGHTFNGWGEVAAIVPAGGLTYEGSYSVNSYTLTYTVDGEVVLTLPVVYGATIPSLKAPEKEGYTFSGWSERPETMPAMDVTIEGSFTELASIFLTINQADNGCVTQHLVQGSSCIFTIMAAEGWTINAVTFNGKDVTSLLEEGNIFTTPELFEDAVLNISYEKIDDSVESTRANAVKVRGHNGLISISGAAEGEAITIYTLDGTMVANETAAAETTSIEVPTQQVYIVKVADKVVKIGM